MSGPFVVVDYSVGRVQQSRCGTRYYQSEEEYTKEDEEGGLLANGDDTGEVDDGCIEDDYVGGDLGWREAVGIAVGGVLFETVVGRRDIVLLNLLIHKLRTVLFI